MLSQSFQFLEPTVAPHPFPQSSPFPRSTKENPESDGGSVTLCLVRVDTVTEHLAKVFCREWGTQHRMWGGPDTAHSLSHSAQEQPHPSFSAYQRSCYLAWLVRVGQGLSPSERPHRSACAHSSGQYEGAYVLSSAAKCFKWGWRWPI